MATEPVFCSECGASNESDAAFCESCGHRLDIAGAEAHASSSEESPPSPRRTMSPRVLALIGVVILVGGGALAFGAPIASFLESIGRDSETSADSVELAPIAQEMQLNDSPDNQLSDAIIGIEPPADAQPRTQAPDVNAMLSRMASAQATRTEAARPQQSDAAPPPPPTTATSIPGDLRTAEETSSRLPAAISTERADAGSGIPAGAVVTTLSREEPPVRPAGRIASGSTISLRSADQVCTDKTRQGAKFRAIVQQDVAGSNGAIIPRGSVITFVVDHHKSATANEKAEFSVAAESLELDGERYAVAAAVDAVSIKPKSRGLMGALIGAATVVTITKASGGDTKQAAAGGVVGGAAGAIIGSQLKTGDGCIEKNAPISITLRSDLTMRSM